MNSNLNNIPLIVLADGTGSRWRRIFHPGAWVNMGGEALIPEYAEKMQVLREADDQIANWIDDLDGLVKSAKKALEQSRLKDVALYLGKINRRFKLIETEGKKVIDVQKESLKQFDTESEETEFEDAILDVRDGHNKTAGWIDNWKRRFFSNRLLDDKFRLERKRAINAVISMAAQVVSKAKDLSKKLGYARDTGKIGMYVETLKKLSALQVEFYKKYKPVYTKYLEEMVRAAEQPTTDAATPAATSPTEPPIPHAEEENPIELAIEPPGLRFDLADTPARRPPSAATDPAIQPSDPLADAHTELEAEEAKEARQRADAAGTGSSPPAPPPPPPPPSPGDAAPPPPQQSKPKARPRRRNNTAKLFISELRKVADVNDKLTMQGMLLAYAESIEETDPVTGLKLIAIAESLDDE